MEYDFKLQPKRLPTLCFKQDKDGGWTVWMEELNLLSEGDTPENCIDNIFIMLNTIYKKEL